MRQFSSCGQEATGNDKELSFPSPGLALTGFTRTALSDTIAVVPGFLESRQRELSPLFTEVTVSETECPNTGPLQGFCPISIFSR